ncbi:MAG: heavy metal sensor histidine kinase [Thermoanaerobaculum sp.]
MRANVSMAARLTGLFVFLSVVVLGAVLLAFYWRVEHHLHQEHQRLLAEVANTLASVPVKELRNRVGFEQASPAKGKAALFAPNRYGFRLQAKTGKVLVETPGMSELPAGVWPPLPAGDLGGHNTNPLAIAPDKFVVVAWRPYAMTGDARGSLLVALDVSEDVELLRDIRNSSLVMVVLAVGSATLLGLLGARKGMVPLLRLTAEVQHVSASDLQVRVADHHYPRELRSLVQAFNGLLERLEKAFGDLASYSANLAHELRTPLAVLRGEIEVALLGNRTEGEYRAVLESALDELDRLARLVEKLLFLCRADRGEMALQKRWLTLEAEAKAVLEFYRPLAEAQAVSLVLEGEGQAFVDRDLFRQALANLVANALQHVSAGGSVRVRVGQEEGRSVVTVADDGCGIDPEIVPFLFQRFPPIPRRKGSGLGLAIVRSIVELHGGGVSIASATPQGTVVRLWFPLGGVDLKEV